MDNLEGRIYEVEQNLAREQRKLQELREELERKKKEEQTAKYDKYKGKLCLFWDQLSTDNLPQMAKLHRKFTRFADRYGSWGQKLLQYRRRQERAEEQQYAAFRSITSVRKFDVDALEKKLDGVKL
jgi:hypothetical protein